MPPNDGVTLLLQEVEYHQWSMTLGWPVQGIFAPFWDGTDVNNVAVSPDQSVIARADDFGKVSFFLIEWNT